MRISEVRKDMQENGILPPDKRGRNNKGVKRKWKFLKHQEAVDRMNLARPVTPHSQSDVTLYDNDGFRRPPADTLHMRQQIAQGARIIREGNGYTTIFPRE